MAQSVDIQELALVVSTKNNSPTVLNLDMLRYSGIVPSDWELAQQPVYTNEVVQLVFKNGVSLLSQSDRIAFIETFANKPLTEAITPALATKYLETLAHADYQAIGVNLRGYVPFNDADAAMNYLSTQLLAAGSWQSFGDAQMNAAINLVYTLEEGRLQLSISEATLQLPEKEPAPIVLFSCNIAYGVAELPQAERPAKLIERISGWESDLTAYQSLINDHFLTTTNATATPALAGVGA